jgi:hypothetical protein
MREWSEGAADRIDLVLENLVAAKERSIQVLSFEDDGLMSVLSWTQHAHSVAQRAIFLKPDASESATRIVRYIHERTQWGGGKVEYMARIIAMRRHFVQKL